MTDLSPARQCRSSGDYSQLLRRVVKEGGFVLQRLMIGEKDVGEPDVIVIRVTAVALWRSRREAIYKAEILDGRNVQVFYHSFDHVS